MIYRGVAPLRALVGRINPLPEKPKNFPQSLGSGRSIRRYLRGVVFSCCSAWEVLTVFNRFSLLRSNIAVTVDYTLASGYKNTILKEGGGE
jgi:hypothetical protein